jgi:hypothetical protein
VSTQAPEHAVSPGLQVHWPTEHAEPGGHARSQAPQVAGFVAMSWHWPAHSAWPGGQPQDPPMQALPAHETPHPPQFAESVAVATQRSPHGTCPSGHTSRQNPSMQESPLGQAAPHAPQCRELVRVSAHSGPEAPSHTWNAHVDEHAPPLQNSPGAQARPQSPQLRASLATAVHTPPQERSPTAQSAVHVAAWQTRPVGHTRPQTPQFRESLAVSTQTPPAQAVCPTGHGGDPSASELGPGPAPAGSRISPVHPPTRIVPRTIPMISTRRRVVARAPARRSSPSVRSASDVMRQA